MAVDMAIFQGTLIEQYCAVSFLSNGFISYILLIILSVGIIYGLNKAGYSVYTFLPATFGTNFFISLIIFTFPCTLAPAISGKFVISMLLLTAVFTAYRVIMNEN